MKRIDKEDLPYPWEINYCRWQFEWLLSPEVWNLIKEHKWPFSLQEDIKGRGGVARAPFEMIALIKAEIDERLEAIGKDGDMCFCRYNNGWTDAKIARDFNLSIQDTSRHIKRGMIYMVGKRKRISYRDWISNGWSEIPRQRGQRLSSQMKKIGYGKEKKTVCS